MQQQIQFEATPFQHTVRLPDNVPDGVLVRFVLSFDDAKTKSTNNNNQWKNSLGSMPNVGHDENFARENNDAKRRAALAHIAAVKVNWQGKPIENRDALYDNARD
jgi:hypothetical protein